MEDTLKAAEIGGKPSYSDLMDKIQAAVDAAMGDLCGCWCWVSDLTDTDAIVRKGDEYLRYPYSVDAAGEVTLGEPVGVKLSWKDAPDAESEGTEQMSAAADKRGTLAFVTDMRGLQFNDATSPVTIEVCRDGVWKHSVYGEVKVTPELRQSFIQNFNANVRKVGDLPLDYDHADGPAPGWVKDLRSEGPSLLASVQLTPSGREKIENGEYRFFSPEWHPNWTDPETGQTHGPTLFGGAFTNKPFFRGMAAINCSETSTGATPHTKEPVMKNNPPAPSTGAAPEDAQRFAAINDRLTAVEAENAVLRAKEERTGISLKFTEMRFGPSKRQVLGPATREKLIEAALALPAEKRDGFYAAVQEMQFAELGESGFTNLEETTNAESLTASEEDRLKQMAARNGLEFADVKRHFLAARGAVKL